MPFFPRFHTPISAFPSDVFRLLNELNQATSPTSGLPYGDKRTFSPSFDIHETDSAFILEGELPGLEDKSRLNIEFTDDNTLLIRGRVERSFQKASPSSESKPESSASAAEGKTETQQGKTETQQGKTETQQGKTETKQGKTDTQVAHRTDDSQKAVTNTAEGCRCWVSERTVGEFQRSFSFPGVVDVEGVKASLENGILRVIVPKKEVVKGRRIEIC